MDKKLIKQFRKGKIQIDVDAGIDKLKQVLIEAFPNHEHSYRLSGNYYFSINKKSFGFSEYPIELVQIVTLSKFFKDDELEQCEHNTEVFKLFQYHGSVEIKAKKTIYNYYSFKVSQNQKEICFNLRESQIKDFLEKIIYEN
jgi:hypothetical protein